MERDGEDLGGKGCAWVVDGRVSSAKRQMKGRAEPRIRGMRRYITKRLLIKYCCDTRTC